MVASPGWKCAEWGSCWRVTCPRATAESTSLPQTGRSQSTARRSGRWHGQMGHPSCPAARRRSFLADRDGMGQLVHLAGEGLNFIEGGMAKARDRDRAGAGEHPFPVPPTPSNSFVGESFSLRFPKMFFGKKDRKESDSLCSLALQWRADGGRGIRKRGRYRRRARCGGRIRCVWSSFWYLTSKVKTVELLHSPNRSGLLYSAQLLKLIGGLEVSEHRRLQRLGVFRLFPISQYAASRR